jgi:choline-phosphate cytidylyltransferase
MGSPIGDIFARVCSAVNHIFFSLTLFEIIGIHDFATRWYLIMALQFLELASVIGRLAVAAIVELKDRPVVEDILLKAMYLIRESEISFILLVILLSRRFVPQLPLFVSEALAQKIFVSSVVVAGANLYLVRAVQRRVVKRRTGSPPHAPASPNASSTSADTDLLHSKILVLLCIGLLALPFPYIVPLSDLSIISDAVVVGLLSVEVYVSSLANRRIHLGVVCIAVASYFNDVFALACSALYVIGMLADLSYSTRIPIFVPIRNVFIDGVFDLCHIGHKRLMENALRHGNRLICGVLSDEDCVGYKRRPVMTTEERCAEVVSCKFVSKVVPGSPVDGLTEEFLKTHNIHVVVCGEEYNRPDDKYYAVPRRMGILRIAPRTAGMSTSVLIARIRAASDGELAAKDKASGKSVVQEGS